MRVSFIPNIFPIAIIGEKYHAEIKTKGIPLALCMLKVNKNKWN